MGGGGVREVTKKYDAFFEQTELTKERYQKKGFNVLIILHSVIIDCQVILIFLSLLNRFDNTFVSFFQKLSDHDFVSVIDWAFLFAGDDWLFDAPFPPTKQTKILCYLFSKKGSHFLHKRKLSLYDENFH